MTLGPIAFGIVIWGAVLLALGVFAYEVYVLLRGNGWLGGDRPAG
ncbi:MAG: hypothetical protein ACI9YT_002616 [Halobacteriales archaeon]